MLQCAPQIEVLTVRQTIRLKSIDGKPYQTIRDYTPTPCLTMILITAMHPQVLSITVHGSPGSEGTPFTACASYGSEFESAATGIVGKELQLSISNPRLWSPSEPNLYNLTVTLSDAPAGLLDSSFQESADSVEVLTK